MDSKPFAQFVRFLTWCSLGGFALLATALIVGLAMLLSSCAGSQPPRVNPPAAAVPVELPNPKPATSTAKADSANSAVKLPEPERRFFGLLPPKKAAEKSLEGRKFKNKGTIIIQTGTGHTAAIATKPGIMATGTEATAVDAARAKAPVQTGAGNTATDNTKAGSKGGAAATAPGAVATATTEKENWLRAALPYVAGAFGAWALLPFLPLPGAGWLLLLVLRRGRSREPETG